MSNKKTSTVVHKIKIKGEVAQIFSPEKLVKTKRFLRKIKTHNHFSCDILRPHRLGDAGRGSLVAHKLLTSQGSSPGFESGACAYVVNLLLRRENIF